MVVVGSVLLLLSASADAATAGSNCWSDSWWGTVTAGLKALFDPQWVAPLLMQAGWLAPVLFMAVFVPVTLLGVPRTLLTVMAGWVFGAWAGALLAWGAGMLAAWVGYELARAVLVLRAAVVDRPGSAGLPESLGEGQDASPGARLSAGARTAVGRERRRTRRTGSLRRVRDGPARWLAALAGRFEEASSPQAGVLGVVGARLVPVLPFALVNYASGALRVPRRFFLLGSGVGLLPGAAAYAAVGAGLSTPGWLQLVTVLVGAVAGAGAAGVAVVRWRRSVPGAHRP